MEKLFQTNDSWMGLILRTGLGLVALLHGAQNLLGWFSGLGFERTMTLMITQLQLPKMVGVMVIMAQFFGGIALLLGAYVRVAAFGVACVAIGSLFGMEYGHGFLTTWGTKQPTPGIEFQLLAVTIAGVIMIWGAGRWSVDRALESPRSRINRERAAREAELTTQPPSHM